MIQPVAPQPRESFRGGPIGPGPEPMNTGHPQYSQPRVLGFRARGLRSRPGMTGLRFFSLSRGEGVEITSIFADTNWITASVAGVTGFVRPDLSGSVTPPSAESYICV